MAVTVTTYAREAKSVELVIHKSGPFSASILIDGCESLVHLYPAAEDRLRELLVARSVAAESDDRTDRALALVPPETREENL